MRGQLGEPDADGLCDQQGFVLRIARQPLGEFRPAMNESDGKRRWGVSSPPASGPGCPGPLQCLSGLTFDEDRNEIADGAAVERPVFASDERVYLMR